MNRQERLKVTGKFMLFNGDDQKFLISGCYAYKIFSCVKQEKTNK